MQGWLCPDCDVELPGIHLLRAVLLLSGLQSHKELPQHLQEVQQFFERVRSCWQRCSTLWFCATSIVAKEQEEAHRAGQPAGSGVGSECTGAGRRINWCTSNGCRSRARPCSSSPSSPGERRPAHPSRAGCHIQNSQHREGAAPAKGENNAGSDLGRGVERGSAEELRPGWPGSGTARWKRPSNAWISPLPLPPREPWMAARLYPCGSTAPSPGRAFRGFVLSVYCYEPAHFVLEC